MINESSQLITTGQRKSMIPRICGLSRLMSSAVGEIDSSRNPTDEDKWGLNNENWPLPIQCEVFT